MNAFEQFDLHGKRAVVTGGATGMGYYMARGLARAGAKVLIAARRENMLQQATEQFNAEPIAEKSIYHVVDLANRASIKSFITAATEKLGGVDILVGNAGLDLLEPIESIKDESIDEIFQVNLSANIELMRGFLPGMRKKQWGRIILVSSASTLCASYCDGMTAYVATKGGLEAATRTIAAETGRDGITVNSIVPGIFMTELFSHSTTRHDGDGNDDYGGEDSGQAFLDAMFSMTALGRGADCREMEGVVQLLASNAGSYITGASIVVDGGLSIMMRPNPIKR